MKPIMLVHSLVAASSFVFSGASFAAAAYPDFTVSTAALGGGGSLGTFVSNDISGQYHEQLTFTGASTFSVSLNFTAQGFNYDDTDPNGSTSLNASQTGLGANYGLLALFSGTGTYNTANGVTTFALNPGGALTLNYDAGGAARFSAPTALGGAYTINANGDVITELATGTGLSGNGSVDCTAPNLCGSFGQATSFALTAAGSSFFISPTPFYSINFQSGQFEGFPVTEGGTVTSSGSLNAVFTSSVPESPSFAMMGLALAGFVATRMFKRSA